MSRKSTKRGEKRRAARIFSFDVSHLPIGRYENEYYFGGSSLTTPDDIDTDFPATPVNNIGLT